MQEIERKFLVSEVPQDLSRYDHSEIYQGYLVRGEQGIEVRLRKRGDAYWLTIKSKDGMVRDEHEISISMAQWTDLWPLTAGKRLTKTRYLIPYGRHTIEVDVYGGGNAGLVVAEVEFLDFAEAESFHPPDWMDLDITKDYQYSNRTLARE